MIAVVIVVGLVLAYALGRSDGEEKVRKALRGLISNDKNKRHKG